MKCCATRFKQSINLEKFSLSDENIHLLKSADRNETTTTITEDSWNLKLTLKVGAKDMSGTALSPSRGIP